MRTFLERHDAGIASIVKRHGLDRRRQYGVFGGCLVVDIEVTVPCSGCSCEWHDGMCSCPSSGCKECGYTGKRRTITWDPISVGGDLVTVEVQP